MSTENDNSMHQMIYSNLQFRSTEELLEIWTKNDREAWTDEAFNVIRELLLKRIGHLPEQNQPGQIEELVDLYHNPDMLIRIATWSKNFSWIIVVISFLLMCGNISYYIYFVDRVPLTYLSVAILMAFGGILCFFVLQAIAELIYLFMDIEENTRGE